MDFYIDIGVAVLLRVLRERRERVKYRPIFVKLAAAIIDAFGDDAEFATQVNSKAKGEVKWTRDHAATGSV